jgi:hypothetical protein
MTVKVLKSAQKAPSRDMCPWMIIVAVESTK